jgi:hypothetical protein
MEYVLIKTKTKNQKNRYYGNRIENIAQHILPNTHIHIYQKRNYDYFDCLIHFCFISPVALVVAYAIIGSKKN